MDNADKEYRIIRQKANGTWTAALVNDRGVVMDRQQEMAIVANYQTPVQALQALERHIKTLDR